MSNTRTQSKRESIALTNKELAYKYYMRAVAKMEAIDNPVSPNHNSTELILMADYVIANMTAMRTHLIAVRALSNTRDNDRKVG